MFGLWFSFSFAGFFFLKGDPVLRSISTKRFRQNQEKPRILNKAEGDTPPKGAAKFVLEMFSLVVLLPLGLSEVKGITEATLDTSIPLDS